MLYLLESKCFPNLTYALPGLKLTLNQLKELNKAWNCAYRKIFGFNLWESVKTFIAGLGKLNFSYTNVKLALNFLRCNLNSDNGTLRYMVMRNVLSDFDRMSSVHNVKCDRSMVLSGLSAGQVEALVQRAFKSSVGL